MTKRNQKLSSSISIGAVLQGSVSKNIGILKSGLAQVGQSIKQVEARQKELAKQRRLLEREGRSVEALDREYEELGRTLSELKRKQERWNRAAMASNRVGAAYTNMVGNLRRTATTLGIGATVAGGAVFGLASSTAQLGDDAAKTADKLGIGIEELQELRFAAERAGVSTSEFDKSLEKMNRNLGEAATGTGTAKDALEQLGLNAEDLIKLEPEEALARIAEAMEGVETAAEKASIASDIFGRSGVGMINMLRGGRQNLDALREAARKTGFVLSEEAARDAEVFQDQLLDTTLTLKGLKNTVGAELLPVITTSMKKIGDALIANRDQVQQFATSFAEGVEKALPVLGQLASGLGTVISKTSAIVSKVAEMVGGWENLGVIVGSVFAAKTVASVVKFGGAVLGLGKAMAGLLLAANPVTVVIGAIAAGALAIAANWGTVKAALEPVINWIGEAFQKLWTLIQPVMNALGSLKEAGSAAVGAVGDMFSGDRREGSLGGSLKDGANIQKNARGGPFRPGWHLTGEDGPELKFENRAGYVANNRALRQLAGYADRAMSLASSGVQTTQTAAAGPTTITNTFHINGAGMSPDELIATIERKQRQARNNGLFDRAGSYGPFGR